MPVFPRWMAMSSVAIYWKPTHTSPLLSVLCVFVGRKDAFEKRMNSFRDLVAASSQTDHADKNPSIDAGLVGALRSFLKSSWFDNKDDDNDSSFYTKLKRLREEMKATESRL